MINPQITPNDLCFRCQNYQLDGCKLRCSGLTNVNDDIIDCDYFNRASSQGERPGERR